MPERGKIFSFSQIYNGAKIKRIVLWDEKILWLCEEPENLFIFEIPVELRRRICERKLSYR